MKTKPTDSYRVPNSIIQGLTTTTRAELNTLTSFEMLTLLGILSLVDEKAPQREVRTTPGELLNIIDVSRDVAHELESKWQNASGEKRKRRYRMLRHSPAYVQKIHDGLQSLFDKSVVILRNDPRSGRRIEERYVHILDSFVYHYRREGETVDLDQLSPAEKINVGTSDRPVWRMPSQRPIAIGIKLNDELVKELSQEKGSICFTYLARKVFRIFTEMRRSPAAIRLTVLILRQTSSVFTRTLSKVLNELSYDVTHLDRAHQAAANTLEYLQGEGIVRTFNVDPREDRLEIGVNRDWYR